MQAHLDRGLGWLSAAALLTGTVIGTGIFLVPSTIARETGSIAGVFGVWIFGGLLSLAGALSYAELGAALPEAGGEYAFLRRAYGPFWGFLFGWQQVLIGKTGSLATMAVAFALFLAHFAPALEQPWLEWPDRFHLTGIQLVALLAIAALTALNIRGLLLGGLTQTVLTALKVGAIVGLAALALIMGQGDWSHFSAPALPSATESVPWSAFLTALVAVLWAYDGWNNLTMVGSEVRDPQRVVPLVLVLGTLGVMLIYLFANVAYLYALPLGQVASADRVAQQVAVAVLGDAGSIGITVAAMISSLAALNGSILSGSRVAYAMARDGLMFKPLAIVHSRFHTPIGALLFQALAAAALIIAKGGDKDAFERLFSYAIFGMWLFYGLSALAVIVLRWREPALPRPFRTPGYPLVPVAFVLVSAAFCVNMLISKPTDTGLGVLIMAVGVPFYFRWRHRGSLPMGD